MKSTLIFLTLTEVSKVVLHVKMQKRHKVFSSLNKCSTEDVLIWCPSYFVTAAVLPNQEQRFEGHPELPGLVLHCMMHRLA